VTGRPGAEWRHGRSTPWRILAAGLVCWVLLALLAWVVWRGMAG